MAPLPRAQHAPPAGRRGLRRVARMSGAVMGQSIAGMRRSRGEVQAKFTQTETEEERQVRACPEEAPSARRTGALAQAAIDMQKGWWELRMIMNEFSMLRSFNPRLLQGGNFGFTDAEMLAAIGAWTHERRAAARARARTRSRTPLQGRSPRTSRPPRPPVWTTSSGS